MYRNVMDACDTGDILILLCNLMNSRGISIFMVFDVNALQTRY